MFTNNYFIFILCSFNLNPSISDNTPDSAESITTLVIVYKYGLADKPDILKGLSNSWKTRFHINNVVTTQKEIKKNWCDSRLGNIKKVKINT